LREISTDSKPMFWIRRALSQDLLFKVQLRIGGS